MIDCKECVEYAHTVLARGEIQVEDVNKLAIDRHVLKGCNVAQTIVSFCDFSKIPTDIICNGFSLKNTIIEVLNFHTVCNEIHATDSKIEEIAEDIKETLAVKLRLKQGEIKAFEGCIHENDGMIYTSNPPQNKCKKCGDFYR